MQRLILLTGLACLLGGLLLARLEMERPPAHSWRRLLVWLLATCRIPFGGSGNLILLGYGLLFYGMAAGR